MNNTISMPQVKLCSLPKLTSFETEDVLFKVVGDDVLRFLVTEIKGEDRIKLRAFFESGGLSHRTFEIQGDKELSMYKLDRAYTRLRKAYYGLSKQNA